MTMGNKVLPRAKKNVDRRDPVTFDNVDPKKAYYLRPDAPNGHIKAVYKKTTLDKLLATNARSPITRRQFFRTDIGHVPRTGHVHPDLLGKNIETVLTHDDTRQNTWQSLKKGQTIKFVLNDDGATTFKIKKVEPATDGSRQWQVTFDSTFKIRGHAAMNTFADGVANCFKANTTRVLVADSLISSTKL